MSLTQKVSAVFVLVTVAALSSGCSEQSDPSNTVTEVGGVTPHVYTEGDQSSRRATRLSLRNAVTIKEVCMSWLKVG